MDFIFLWIFTIIRVIIMIPFLTLLERKVLRYIQIRKGPKKVRFLGILQPLSDGLKLFFKESGRMSRSKKIIFFFSPLLKFFFMLVLFVLFVVKFPYFSLNLGLILYLCFSSLLVYTIISSG
jgi:NADH:ubiquinone oxidoreductase subunit H